MVVRAKIQNGVFVPIDPLPAEWREGSEVAVAHAETSEISDEEWAALTSEPTVEELEDDRRVQEAINEQRLLLKEQVARRRDCCRDPLSDRHQSSERGDSTHFTSSRSNRENASRWRCFRHHLSSARRNHGWRRAISPWPRSPASAKPGPTRVRLWPLEDQADIAEQYGLVYHELRDAGRSMSQVDMMLAATSRFLNATILTSDRDFEALPDIPTENWLAK